MAGWNADKVRSSVDLPIPFCPNKQVSSLALMVALISLTTMRCCPLTIYPMVRCLSSTVSMRLTFVCWELFLFRSEFVAQTLHACEIGFGRSERKEHIQAYGQVILIVGDEE